MEDKFHELALEKLAGRASAEESRKLEDYLGQDPALQAEYDRLELEVRAAKDLIPLLKESDADSEDLPEHEKNLLMAEVRSVFGAGDQQSEPTHEADPQQEEPFWKYWKWLGGLTATALLAFIILTPNPEVTEDEPKYTEKSMDDFADQELDNFLSGEGRELQSKIEDLGIQDNALSESIEKLRSLLEKLDKDPESDEDYLAWKKKREDLRDEKGNLEKRLEETFLAYSKFKLTPTSEQEERWKNLLSDGEQDAVRLKNQYEDLNRELEKDGSGEEPVFLKPMIAFAMRINDVSRGGDEKTAELKPLLEKLIPGTQLQLFDEVDDLDSWREKWLVDDKVPFQAKIIYNELIGGITVLGRYQGKDLSREKIEGVTAKNLESKLKEALKQISAWTKQ